MTLSKMLSRLLSSKSGGGGEQISFNEFVRTQLQAQIDSWIAREEFGNAIDCNLWNGKDMVDIHNFRFVSFREVNRVVNDKKANKAPDHSSRISTGLVFWSMNAGKDHVKFMEAFYQPDKINFKALNFVRKLSKNHLLRIILLGEGHNLVNIIAYEEEDGGCIAFCAKTNYASSCTFESDSGHTSHTCNIHSGGV